MNELDLFRDFRRGLAAPSSDAKRHASALLAAAVAGAQMPSTRRRRLGGSLALAGGRRHRVLVLAVAALVVVAVAAASAFGVRSFLLDRGFIGLPPEGATPSAPETGELVLRWVGRSATLARPDLALDPRGFLVAPLVRVWVYADGRLIWSREGSIPEGANEVTSGYLQQRLTPEGVELLRSEVVGLLDRSRTLLKTIPADDDWPPGPGDLALFVPGDYGSDYGSVAVRDGDRFVRLQWQGIGFPGEAEKGSKRFHEILDDLREHYEGTIATPEQLSALRRVDALLTDPASVLPSSAWAFRDVRAYVPSHYSVCIDTTPPKDASQLLSLLPTRAADLLRDKSRKRSEDNLVEAREGGRVVVIGRSVTYCSKLTTKEAREVAEALSGLDPAHPRVRLAYRVAEGPTPVDPTTIWFAPYFPDGQSHW